MRAFIVLRAHETKIRPSHIVDEEEHDVGFGSKSGNKKDKQAKGKSPHRPTNKKGKLRGPYTVFYENGHKKLEGTYKYRDSVLDGYFITYHENGQEHQSAYLWKESIDGVMTESDEEGRLIKYREYEKGRFSGYYNEEEELVEVQGGYPNWEGYYDEIEEVLVALPPATEIERKAIDNFNKLDG